MRTGSSSIAISTWTICASTKRKHCDVRPEPRPVQPSTVLAAVQTAARRLRRWPAASLDRGCARRSANRQVGANGWVCPIEQRDANFDLSSAGPPPMTDLLNIAHTTLFSQHPKERHVSFDIHLVRPPIEFQAHGQPRP